MSYGTSSGPNSHKYRTAGYRSLLAGHGAEKRGWPLNPSFCASVRTAALLYLDVRASLTLVALAATLAAVRRGLVFPLTSKRRRFAGEG